MAFFAPTAPASSQPFWPQFRGPGGQGIATAANPPLIVAKSNAAWAVELAPGHSSPVVWGNKIFLTCFQDKKLDCRAYDRKNGKLLWARAVPAEEIEHTHPFSNPAAPTPAVNAGQVVFYFGSFGLLAFSHDGQLLWQKKLPAPVSQRQYGSASSPIIHSNLVLLALDSDSGGSRLLAFQNATGEPAWEAARPFFQAGWSTPIVTSQPGHSEIVLLGSKKLVAYDPADGKELWSMPGFTTETMASPVCDGSRVFACSAGLAGRSSLHFESPFWPQLLKFDRNKDGKVQINEVPENFQFVQRPELPEGHPGRFLPLNVRAILTGGMDRDKDGAVSEEECKQVEEAFEKSDVPVLMALRAGPCQKEEERVVWKYSRDIPEVPSPLAYEGKLYLVRDGGILHCFDAATGSLLYRERLGASGGYSATPVAAQHRIYLASQLGTITVIDARSKELKVLARNPLGEQITATPALVEDSIYVRTAKHLFAFSGP